MSDRAKVLWGITAFYVFGLIALAVIFGISTHMNHEFLPQNEFKLVNWVSLGVFSINRAVLYLFIAALLTIFTMVFIARRMEARPNRVQTAVEVLFSLMRDNITRGNMPDYDGRQVVSIHRGAVLVHLVLQPDRLPAAADEHRGEIHDLRRPHPDVRAVRRDGERVGAARAGVDHVHRLQLGGDQSAGPDRLHQEPDPFRDHGPILFLIAPLEVISTFLRLISLTVRLFANILAGHLIILFMAGGLGVILGASWLGWFTLPFGIVIYLFELGLVATLQAFIFATLSAIYLGGAVSHH